MRILHINEFSSPIGGIETYLASLLPAQKEAGLDVGLFYYRKADRISLGLEGMSSFVPSLRGGPNPQALSALQGFRPDIVSLHQIIDPRLLAWIAERWPVVQFVHVHFPVICPGDGKFLSGRKEICRRKVGPFCIAAPYLQKCASRRPWRVLSKYFKARVHAKGVSSLRRVLVASEYMRDECVLNDIAPEKISVTRLPVPDDLFGVPDPGTRSGPPKILFVGRLTKMKGVDFLLRALGKITAPYHCQIVGEGPDVPGLKRLTEDLGLAERVSFIGWRDRPEIMKYYQSAAVVAFPSLWPEPFGLVGLEGMAFAKPIVAFDVGGVREWLRDGENGYLIPAKDLDAFTGALQRLLADPKLAETLGRNGREMVRSHFSMKLHLTLLSKIYGDVLTP